MTSRLLASALAVSVLVVVAGACDDGTVDGYWAGGGRRDPCSQYSSCGDCTPVLGCGWCTTGVGQGMCAADPDECASAQAFSWTWNASGCFSPADAGVGVVTDAATSVPPGSPTDGSTSAADSGMTAMDAGEASVEAGTEDASDASAVSD